MTRITNTDPSSVARSPLPRPLQREPRAGRWRSLLVALFLIAFLVVPLVRVIRVAFTGPDGGFSLVHFGDFFRTALLREAFWNSIYVAAMTVVLASLIAVPLATILSRFRFRGAALIHTLGVVPLVMPPFVGAVAMQLIYGRNGSINLLLNDDVRLPHPVHGGTERRDLRRGPALFSVHSAQSLRLAVATSIASMEEAAQNLGARGFTLFRRIVFPLAMPGYVAGAALVFVKVFDDLATPLLLNVTNMLAPQAYLKITSVGDLRPDGLRHLRDHDRSARSARWCCPALALRGRDFATAAARRRRAGAAFARALAAISRPLRSC